MEQTEPTENTKVQRFAVLIEKVIDKDSGKIHVSMKTQGEGIPLAEASIILDGWCKKVAKELSGPYVDHMRFGSTEQQPKEDSI